MLILSFGNVSGAHMNPIVTLAAVFLNGFPKSRAPIYIVMQVAGAISGVCLAHVMFDLPLLQASGHVRFGPGVWAGEIIATFGLLIAIARCSPYGTQTVGAIVAAYIGGAYWFTSSTSFANPAVTIARSFTDTFAGIRGADTPGFIAAQVIALALGVAFLKWMRGPLPPNKPSHACTTIKSLLVPLGLF